MIRIQPSSNRIVWSLSRRSLIRSMMTTNNHVNNKNINAGPFQFQFIPSINNNSKNSNTTTTTTDKGNDTKLEPRKLTSHSLPSQGILDKHHEMVKAKENADLEQLNKAKEIIKQARESGTISTNHPNKATSTSTSTNSTTATTTTTTGEPKKRKKRTLRARKAVITLSPTAIEHLKALLELPEPQMIRVSTKNRGCSGTQYDLSYVTKPEKFDEIVEQDGIKIIIDSKALFSVVGSEMDWIDDQLNTKFIFKNPNSKGTCGCGESFMT